MTQHRETGEKPPVADTPGPHVIGSPDSAGIEPPAEAWSAASRPSGIWPPVTQASADAAPRSETSPPLEPSELLEPPQVAGDRSNRKQRKGKGWAVVLAGVVVFCGGGVTGAVLIDPTGSDEYAALEASQKSVESKLTDAKSDYEGLQEDYDVMAGGIRAREVDVEKRESAVTTTEEKVKAAETAVKVREDAVTGAEKTKPLTQSATARGWWDRTLPREPIGLLSRSDPGATGASTAAVPMAPTSWTTTFPAVDIRS